MVQISTPNPAYLPGSIGPGNTPYLDPTPVPTTPETINSSNTAPQAPINYTVATPTPAYPVSAITPPPPPPTPTVNSANTLTKQIEDLNTSMTGKSAAQTAAETQVGLPADQAAYNDLSAKLTGLQNEAKAIPLQLQNDAEGRGITAGGLAPIQAAALNKNSIAALSVSTLLAATSGQIANAQAQADKIVAEKYGPIQAQIDAATANLKLIINSPAYSAEEKATAQQQLDVQNAKQAAIDAAKANTTAIQNAAITAAQNSKTFTATTDYPSVTVALTAMQNAKTPAEALAIATKAGLVPPVKLDTSVVEVGGRKLLVNNQTGATLKDLGAATSSTSQTAAEKTSGALANFSSAFVPGAKMANGTPVIDGNGFLTPAAFKAAVADAPANGLTRQQFIQNFGYLIYAPKGVPVAAYGLTAAEGKLISGIAPVAQ